MARREGSIPRLTEPVRSLWHRFAYLILFVGAFGFLVLGKADIVLVERTRVAIADAISPILAFVSKPAAAVSDRLADLRELRDAKQDNIRLKEENERLKRWQAVARRLEAENAALRAITGFVPDPSASFVTARVIGDSAGPFVSSVLVNAGARDGVRKGQAAMTGDGLAGRVAEVGQRHARILLITDLNARVPVRVEGSRQKAILAGENSANPRLLYLDDMSSVLVGQVVTTSGDAGLMPPGLPVGRVVSKSKSAVRVVPYVDWARMEYLRIVDFRLSDLTREDPRNVTPLVGRTSRAAE
ncbi:MAG: rod shape-determining protein MreC [Alphaproteobacteria bacterium]|nr:rod shape-determining protein MreC [Alphaproteobacteria bacterium]